MKARSAQSRVEEAIKFLVGRGLNEREVRGGSIPEPSLRMLGETVLDRLPKGRPVRALHVGNFVGVSLCFISSLITEHHPDSLVVSIDPNVVHRGVQNPQLHTLELLHHFGLLESNLIITGYTLERRDDAEDEAEYLRARENVFHALEVVGGRFELILLDGNHEEDYLAREVTAIRRLAQDNAIIAFDDIKDWPGVAAVFRKATGDHSFVELHNDGRIGILQLRAPAADRPEPEALRHP